MRIEAVRNRWAERAKRYIPSFTSQDTQLKVGNDINTWANRLKPTPHYVLSHQLDTKIQNGLEGVRMLRLPGYKQATIPLATFLEDPQKHFDFIGSERYWINLPPTEQARSIQLQVQRFRQIDLSRRRVRRYIRKHISPSEQSNYDVMLSEYHKNLYGGVIVINPDASLVIEVVRGANPDLVSGEQTPEFIMERKPFESNFTYNFDNEELRLALARTLLSIPHTVDGTRLEFPAGLYEFALIKRKKGGALEPVFFEHVNNPVYYQQRKSKMH